MLGLVLSVFILSGCETVQKETFTVTFVYNSDTTNVVKEVVEGQTVSEPVQPTKDGYDFGGWFSDSSLNVPYDFSSTVNGNLMLYAKWDEVIVTYQVSFYDGEASLSTQDIVSGEQAQTPTDPTKGGYSFIGWYTDAEYTNQFNFETAIDRDISLYAKWDEVVEYYTVEFIGSSGSVLFTQIVEEGNYPTLPDNPFKDGYTFDAWYQDESFSTIYNFETPVDSDISVYANWNITSMCGDSEIDPNYYTIGMVTDTGGIDYSFNQMTWEGIVAFASENNIPESNYCYLTSSSDADYRPNIEEFIDNNIDLIVAPGFLFYDAILQLASEYPNQQFLVIDNYVDAPNVVSALFTEQEQGFLAGVAAALKAQEAGQDTVGFIGGMDFSLIQEFEAGYEAGVWAVDPTMTVLVDYAGTFADPAMGQALAVKQYDLGAYVIFHAAGGTANGIIFEAKYRRSDGDDVWVIGIDLDQYTDGLYNETDSAVLTSALKRMDNVVNIIATSLIELDAVYGEIITFNLALGGVSLPPVNPNLSQSQLDTIAEYVEDVLQGTIHIPLIPSRLDN